MDCGSTPSEGPAVDYGSTPSEGHPGSVGRGRSGRDSAKGLPNAPTAGFRLAGIAAKVPAKEETERLSPETAPVAVDCEADEDDEPSDEAETS